MLSSKIEKSVVSDHGHTNILSYQSPYFSIGITSMTHFISIKIDLGEYIF